MNNKISAKLFLVLIPLLLLCACGDDEEERLYNQFEGEAKYVIHTCGGDSYLTDNYTVEGNFIVLNKYCIFYDTMWSYIRYGNLKIDMSGIIIEERQLVGK